MAKEKRHSGKDQEASLGATYGRSPAMLSLSDLKALNALPQDERVAAAAAFVEGRNICPVCEARRLKAAARTRRWRERHAK
jgi:hypothetical protein